MEFVSHGSTPLRHLLGLHRRFHPCVVLWITDDSNQGEGNRAVVSCVSWFLPPSTYAAKSAPDYLLCGYDRGPGITPDKRFRILFFFNQTAAFPCFCFLSDCTACIEKAGNMVVNTIHWFRKGLRLHDNPALKDSIQGSDTLRCIYILDPWFAGSSNLGINRWR